MDVLVNAARRTTKLDVKPMFVINRRECFYRLAHPLGKVCPPQRGGGLLFRALMLKVNGEIEIFDY